MHSNAQPLSLLSLSRAWISLFSSLSLNLTKSKKINLYSGTLHHNKVKRDCTTPPVLQAMMNADGVHEHAIMLDRRPTRRKKPAMWNDSCMQCCHSERQAYTQRIWPLFLPLPIWSLPTQNRCRAWGRSSPSISLSFFFVSWPCLNRTPFSSSATSRRGIAAAVPLRVCAKGSGADSDSAERGGRYRICRRRDW